MERIVTLDKAINAIKVAAEEIPADDFISYSTILDVHLSYAHDVFSQDEQHKLLEALGEILETHEDLAREISWDLISVLLPFLESPSPATIQLTESHIAFAAAKGNPREVFIKIVESLSAINWSPPLTEDEDGYVDVDGDGDDEEEDEEVREAKDKSRKETTRNALRKFYALLSALSIVHPRIFSKFPSRFLSTQLTTLLGVFTKAIQWLDRQDVDAVLRALLEFAELVKPTLMVSRKQSIVKGERPPLPPRASTNSMTPLPVPISTDGNEPAKEPEGDSPETTLQARLLQSFLSHVLELYLLRTRNVTGRGLVVGWAGQYDSEVVRKGKSKVPGGETAIDDERTERAVQREVKALTEDIEGLCEALGLRVDELIKICENHQEPESPTDEDHEDPAPPSSAEDIPLSKTGALFLLAQRLTHYPLSPLSIFPNHSDISQNFLVNGSGQHQPAVVDAVLFLGALALHQGGGLGSAPESDNFLLYLQTFAAISATSSSPQARFLAHYHVSTCISKHPDEAVRLAYIKDTLEHCPFETLKAAVVGILKDEILSASLSTPPKQNSIFASPVCLEDLFDMLFPEVEVGDADDFKNYYPTLVATANFYYFLVLSPVCREKLGVNKREFAERVEGKFLTPIGKALEGISLEGGGMEADILKDVIERIREKVREVCV
ncbi:YAP-binding/ALF4/Glomulin [Tuber borchii]|uniref:YAP-binding/ALF4/Glomulin n=1 Tax=Tuber borchii TaxID=42251 RepID=A0A2T7A742_TUBBO|nr:YAP-binding/ALF4/Glomulin [Tuber borchii]